MVQRECKGELDQEGQPHHVAEVRREKETLDVATAVGSFIQPNVWSAATRGREESRLEWIPE